MNFPERRIIFDFFLQFTAKNIFPGAFYRTEMSFNPMTEFTVYRYLIVVDAEHKRQIIVTHQGTAANGIFDEIAAEFRRYSRKRQVFIFAPTNFPEIEFP